MTDETPDPIAQARAAKIDSIGIQGMEERSPSDDVQVVGGEHPSDEQPRNEKGQWIPKARFDQVNVRMKEAEQRANLWDQVIEDQDVVDLIRRKFLGEPGSAPTTPQSPRRQQQPDFDDEEMDPRYRRELQQRDQEIQQLKRQVAQVTAPMLELVTSQQRKAIKEEFPDYDQKRDDPQIKTMIATGRARTMLDAMRLMSFDRGSSMPSQRATDEQRTAARVQPPAEVQDYMRTLDKDYAEAKRDWQTKGNQEALDAMMVINQKRTEIQRRIASRGV